MKAFDNKYLKRIVFSIQMISMILLIVMAYSVQLIPMKYLIGVGVFFVALNIF